MHFCRRKIAALEAMGVMFPKRSTPQARREIKKLMTRCCHPAAAWQKRGNQAASWEVCILCGARMSYWDRRPEERNVAAKLYLERTVRPMASDTKPAKPKLKMKDNPKDAEGWEVVVSPATLEEQVQRQQQASPETQRRIVQQAQDAALRREKVDRLTKLQEQIAEQHQQVLQKQRLIRQQQAQMDMILQIMQNPPSA